MHPILNTGRRGVENETDRLSPVGGFNNASRLCRPGWMNISVSATNLGFEEARRASHARDIWLNQVFELWDTEGQSWAEFLKSDLGRSSNRRASGILKATTYGQ